MQLSNKRRDNVITQISFLRAQGYQPWRNQALEAHLLEIVQPSELILYLWQNDKTVVVGRNQDAWAECYAQELEADGGYLARRTSGGGAVYHDKENLNFTFVLHDENYDVARQCSVIQHALDGLGLKVELSGRNDLTIDGAKFSGNAYYHKNGRSYHHGTILLDVNTTLMSRYLRPSQKKLQSKGVASVQSRVVNLKSLLPELTIDHLASCLVKSAQEVYACETVELESSRLDVARLKEFEAQFSDKTWRYALDRSLGSSPVAADSCISLRERFSWGEVELRCYLDEKGSICQVSCNTDALMTEGFEEIENQLKGTHFYGGGAQGSLRAYAARLTEEGREELSRVCKDLIQLIESAQQRK